MINNAKKEILGQDKLSKTKMEIKIFPQNYQHNHQKR